MESQLFEVCEFHVSFSAFCQALAAGGCLLKSGFSLGGLTKSVESDGAEVVSLRAVATLNGVKSAGYILCKEM